MTLPLVSIAIPAYNHARFIESCLESVCAQTYPELELVLIDDGSTDATLEVARRFLGANKGRFRRVVLERQENQGVSATSNACIEVCQGEWVHLLGSDDVLYPNKVERIQAAIEVWGQQNVALVHSDADYIDENGAPVIRREKRARPPEGPDSEAYRWLFFGQHSVVNPTIALRRDAFLSLGGFDRNLALEDLDCWLRLSVKFAVARVPEVLACYRKHPGNTLRRRIRMLGAIFQTYGKFIAANGDLIPAADLRRHFRLNLWRFWRRIRRQEPTRFPSILANVVISYIKTPRAEDYRRFAAILNRVAN